MRLMPSGDNTGMEDNTRYWVAGVLLVVAAMLAAWWYTAAYPSPLIPNTGVVEGQPDDPLEYVAQ